MDVSYATKRKQRIIESRLGQDWKEKTGGKSIDAVYNQVIGDSRKTLFVKIGSDLKDKLDRMARTQDVRLSELIERMITVAYADWDTQQRLRASKIAHDYSGTEA
jgi:hypothetical protein